MPGTPVSTPVHSLNLAPPLWAVSYLRTKCAWSTFYGQGENGEVPGTGTGEALEDTGKRQEPLQRATRLARVPLSPDWDRASRLTPTRLGRGLGQGYTGHPWTPRGPWEEGTWG